MPAIEGRRGRVEWNRGSSGNMLNELAGEVTDFEQTSRLWPAQLETIGTASKRMKTLAARLDKLAARQTPR